MVAQPHLAFEQSGDARNQELHSHLVFVITRAREAVAARDAFGQHLRVLEQGIDAVRGGLDLCVPETFIR